MFRFLKQSLIRLLEKRGYCVSFGEPATFDGILAHFETRSQPFRFLQIGAYDGKESDPIHARVRECGWHGVLVEPQPDAFAKLVQNYHGVPGLQFENAAIAKEAGQVAMYRLKPEFAHLFPHDAGTITSFQPDHILKHLTAPVAAETALAEIRVPAISFPDLLTKFEIRELDLLQIDAEGFDCEILRMINFDQILPRVIHYEHANLADQDKLAAMQLLLDHNYKLVVGCYDVTAFQSRWGYS